MTTISSLNDPDGPLVKEKPPQTKSMMASKNLPIPITKAADGYHWIRVLAAELALRLNEARQETPNLWPRTIVLHARKGIIAFSPGQPSLIITRLYRGAV